MTEIWCAQKASTLEGVTNFDLEVDDLWDITLERLNARVCRLEQHFGIDLPPPMLEATCWSLAYRLERLDRRSSPRKELQTPSYQNVAPEKLDMDRPALEAVLARLFIKSPDLSGKDDITWFRAASQQLCHAAGKQNLMVPDMLETFSQVLAFAVGLSLEMDVRKRYFRHPGLVVPGFNPRPHHKSKACCGCCSCFCHRDKHREPILKPIAALKQSRWRRIVSFKWLKQVMCFKTKGDDDSSVSTLTDADD